MDVAAGYGLVLVLAVWGPWLCARRKAPAAAGPEARSASTDRERLWLLPAIWMLCGLAVIYLPVPFQRKMMEGLHIPLCILGGTALASVVGSRRDATCRVRPDAAIEATSRVPTPALSPETMRAP